ncbi:MAG TPA: hypothetical protein VK473_07400 [Terriglobales bacterium]|nr:hypothetical protein [Terriglobales bacterium]
MTNTTSDLPYFVLALTLGATAAFVHLRYHDLSLLLVSISAMSLALARPERPWRWALVVALCLPAGQLLAYLTREHPTRAMVFGSFIGLVPGLIAAYGGAVMRRGFDVLFPRQPGR